MNAALLMLAFLLGALLTWIYCVRRVAGRVPRTVASAGRVATAEAGVDAARLAGVDAAAPEGDTDADFEEGVDVASDADEAADVAALIALEADTEGVADLAGQPVPAAVGGEGGATEAQVPASGTGAAASVGTGDGPVVPGRFGAGSADSGVDGRGPQGWLIKGNANSMLFHAPESPWYRRTIAEVWFDSEESAVAAGFARWDSRRRVNKSVDLAGVELKADSEVEVAGPEQGELFEAEAVSPSPDVVSEGQPAEPVQGDLFEAAPPEPVLAVADGVPNDAEAAVVGAVESPSVAMIDADADAQAEADAEAEAEADGDGDGDAGVWGRFGPGTADAAADGSGPEGWTIKGNANSMLFHTSDSPWYGRTIAEVWFDSEASAKAAGFKHWNRKLR